jgi:hypothetical protein
MLGEARGRAGLQGGGEEGADFTFGRTQDSNKPSSSSLGMKWSSPSLSLTKGMERSGRVL